ALRGITRWRSHCRRGGPNRAWLYSQAWKRSDDRAKHHSATSMNGVVGSTGSRTPRTPRPTKAQPRHKRTTRRAAGVTGGEPCPESGGDPASAYYDVRMV